MGDHRLAPVPRRAPAALSALAVLVFAAPAAAQAPPTTIPGEPGPGLTTACGGRAIAPDRVIAGEFGTNVNKDYMLLPFDVPRGTTAVRVKYCWDRPESGTMRHTLDLGLYGPRQSASKLWGESEFRGWGGSSHPDVTLSAEGFSTEAQYTASPRVEVPGKTTRGFIPGRIKPGEWAVELGVGAVIAQERATPTARSSGGWRSSSPRTRRSTTSRTRRPPTTRPPPGTTRGWYAGDMHVHAEHSNYGAATMTETFDYAFKPLAEGGAGLDFMTLSDYVSGYPAWNEIGRYQSLYPNNLVIRSDEVITYKGHTNNHASAKFVDYRTTPVYERVAGGSLKLLSGGREPREHVPRGAPRRRLDPDQPPADLPAHHAGLRGPLPRLLLGVLGRADRLLAARRARDRHRTLELRRQSQPVHPRWRSRSTSACSGWATRSPRWARATPTTPAT